MFDDDVELYNLFKRLGIGIVVLLVFGILFFFVLLNKFSPRSPEVVNSVKKGETIYVLIDEKKCSTCKKIKEILKEEDIKYYEINVDKDSHYKEFLDSISATENEVVIPTLMYIKDGKLDSTVVDIKDEDVLKVFIKNTKKNNE